jgi:Fe2+ or Zn2+ uptake regulation protein
MAGSRTTNQRKLLEEEVKHFQSFFDADKLYRQVSKKNEKIGIATVYRFLKSYAEEGKIHSYSCNGKTTYSSNKKNHCHFTCGKCKNVKHIRLKKLDFIQKEVKGDICHFQISITGICDQCRNSESKEEVST